MRAQDNTEGVARLIVVRLFLWLVPTFRWKYEVNVSHADLGGSPYQKAADISSQRFRVALIVCRFPAQRLARPSTS